jgi:Zinc carboxypeptidase
MALKHFTPYVSQRLRQSALGGALFLLLGHMSLVSVAAPATIPVSVTAPPSTTTSPASVPNPPVAAKDRYADIPGFTFDTPAFANNKKDFTTDAELTQFIQKRIAPSPYASWRSLGKTSGGKELHCVIFTQDGRSDPVSLANNRKPTVWIIAQQHGDEPAGAEAALEVMRRLVSGELKPLLERINVIVVPRANPDGAALSKRATAKGDMNRDHSTLSYFETQRLRKMMNDYPPTVVVDAHEFTVAGRWVERFGLAQASDILVQSASHPGVSDSLKKIARDVFDPALQTSWMQHGLKHYSYHTLNQQGPQAFVQMGGNYSGIGRNAMGLLGAVSYLIETRGVGIGKDNYARRVGSHVISMSTIMRTTAAHADALRVAQREAKRHPVIGSEWTVDHVATKENRTLPMIDPATNEDRPLSIEFQNSLFITPTLTRAVPAAYIIPSASATNALIDRLHNLGLNVHRLMSAQELDIEQYTVQSIKQEVGEQGAPNERLFTELKRVKKTFDAGSLWIPIAQGYQPHWRLAMVIMEPESVGSLSSTRLIGAEPAISQAIALARVVGTTTVVAPQLLELD